MAIVTVADALPAGITAVAGAVRTASDVENVTVRSPSVPVLRVTVRVAAFGFSAVSMALLNESVRAGPSSSRTVIEVEAVPVESALIEQPQFSITPVAVIVTATSPSTAPLSYDAP